MFSGLVDGLFAALVALLMSVGLVMGPKHEAVVLGAPTAPTATPAATDAAAPADAPASADGVATGTEIDGYMAQILEPLHGLRDNFDSMQALMQAPYVTDDGWRKDAAAAFDGIQAAHKALLQVEPPASLVEAHAALTAGTEKCSQGAEVARQSLQEDSVVGLYAAAQLMKACGEGVTEAAQMITQAQQ